MFFGGCDALADISYRHNLQSDVCTEFSVYHIGDLVNVAEQVVISVKVRARDFTQHFSDALSRVLVAEPQLDESEQHKGDKAHQEVPANVLRLVNKDRSRLEYGLGELECLLNPPKSTVHINNALVRIIDLAGYNCIITVIFCLLGNPDFIDF